jgi:lipoprotein-anchoring transpeptidase ErfK/SrfK
MEHRWLPIREIHGETDMTEKIPHNVRSAINATLTRRVFLAGVLALPAGCNAPGTGSVSAGATYGPVTNEPFPITGIDVSARDPELLRQEVAFSGPYRPGTVVVNIAERRLYLAQAGGRALRYAVGVGREEALNFQGSAIIGRKAEWPSWTPTATMISAIPRYAAYAGGMPGGIDNPLGARALYLYRDGEDTHFRLHGTMEPETIGTAVSSGCIRLVNQDIIDLYNRVPVGAPVIVVQK